MTDIYLHKRYGQLQPASESDAEAIATLPDGGTFKAVVTRPRNVKFHRRYFALLDVLYNCFEPPQVEHNGVIAVKNRERFRKDVAISTGHYELVVNVKGDVRAEAKSISFAAMDETEFAQLYSKTINYGLANIAKGRTREEIDNWVDAILSFD